MAFTEKDMIKLGLKEISPGKWEKAPTIKTIQLKTVIKSNAVKRGRTSNSELPVRDSFDFLVGVGSNSGNDACVITLSGVMPGLNKLLREHFMVRKRRKEQLKLRLAALPLRSFEGKVKITFTGYCSVLSDWENFCGKFKVLGDALVDMKVIEDDSPEYIVKFVPEQVKCRRKDQRVEVRIEQIS